MLCNKKVLSDVFGISEKTLSEDIKAGMPVKVKASHRGQSHEFDTADVFGWQLEKKLAQLGNGGDLSRNQEQARLFKVQADRQQLQLEKERLNLIPSATVEKVWGGMTSAARQRLLGLPSRLAAVCSGQPFGIIEARALEIICEALSEIHAYDPEDYLS